MKTKNKRLAGSLIILLSAVLLLLFSTAVRQELLQALSLSVSTVIPGLFPFLILSEIAAGMGFLQPNGRCAQQFSKKFFGLSASCIPAIVFGLTGGYLTGVKNACTLYENGRITKAEAQKLCSFCVSPGLAFAVSAVGNGILRNTSSGILLFFCCTLASLLLGLYCKKTQRHSQEEIPIADNENFAVVFTRAVQKSAAACLSLSAWMAAFATIQAVVFPLLPSFSRPFFLLFSEVTAGVMQTAHSGNLPLCATVLAFGGFCIFCQLLPDLQKLEVPAFTFLKNRILCAVLTGVFCKLGLYLFPTADISLSAAFIRSCSINPAASFFLLLACFIFILDLAPARKTWYTDTGR